MSKHNEITVSFITPKLLEGNRSPTLNGMGYVFLTPTPFDQAFLEKECVAGKRILEVGVGFNNIPTLALQKNVAEYVANDISKEHLDLLFAKASKILSPEQLSKLKLVKGRAPEIMRQIEGKFDAILANKIIHFLSPDEIIEFLSNSKLLLKKGGKIYVTTSSPYSYVYNIRLDEYLEKKSMGQEFPGYFHDMMHKINHTGHIDKLNPDFLVPESMVLFARPELVNLFEQEGFNVIESYSLTIPQDDLNKWEICSDEQSRFACVVAQLK